MSPELLALSIVILLFSVITHEVMHGFMALKFGDHTAQAAGRLTFNPIPHIDPVGTILLPGLLLFLNYIGGGVGFLIGWAKPVPVNPLHFRNIRKGELMVSLAGVLSNFGLAIIAAAIYHLIRLLNGSILFSEIMRFSVSINLMLAVFNLLPVPPLDGSKVLLSQLPYNLAKKYEAFSSYGFFILLFLLYFNVLGLILYLVVNPLHWLLQIPPF